MCVWASLVVDRGPQADPCHGTPNIFFKHFLKAGGEVDVYSSIFTFIDVSAVYPMVL